jgi:hypothetical protein
VEGNGEPTPLLELGLGSNGSHSGIRSCDDRRVDPPDLFFDWKVSNSPRRVQLLRLFLLMSLWLTFMAGLLLGGVLVAIAPATLAGPILGVAYVLAATPALGALVTIVLFGVWSRAQETVR